MRTAISVCFFLLLGPFPGIGQDFPHSAPEEQGVSSPALLTWLDTLARSPHELHGFVLLRHNKEVAAGWSKPYGPDRKHTLYSVSKSFTATAIGFAIQEGLLSLTDTVIHFFPDRLPAEVPPYLARLTLRDLLIMASGHDPEPTRAVRNHESDWVRGFLSAPLVHPPGSHFLYNSLATYLAGALLQKTTGEPLTAYLTPRLFEPLGIQGADWEADLEGVETGGWGMRATTRDLAKLGNLYLRFGWTPARQLLDSGWVREATRAQILQHPDWTEAQRAASDWEQGYGYQFWRSRHQSYRADGAYGQYILILPEQDAVLAIHSETHDMQGMLNLVWSHVLPAFHPQPLPPDPLAEAALALRCEHLALPLDGPSRAALEPVWNQRPIAFAPNDIQTETISLNFFPDHLRLDLDMGASVYGLRFGRGYWLEGETSRLGPNLLRFAPGHMAGLTPLRVAGAFAWKSPNELELTLRYIESPHRETFALRFDEKTVTLTYRQSDQPARVLTLKSRSQ